MAGSLEQLRIRLSQLPTKLKLKLKLSLAKVRKLREFQAKKILKIKNVLRLNLGLC